MNSQSIVAVLVMVLLGSLSVAGAGVVSHYTVNSKTVTEGATFEEVRAIAGDPQRENMVRDSNQEVEWIYQCRRKGAGRCTVVTEGGKKEMTVRFRNGRMKGITFRNL